MTEETPLVETEFVYLGKRMTNDGKVAIAVIKLTRLMDIVEEIDARHPDTAFPSDITDRIERAASLFAPGRKHNPFHMVGSIYVSNAAVEENSIRRLDVVGAKWSSKKLPEEAMTKFVLAWRTLNDAVVLHKRKLSAEKNAENDPALANALAVLKARYKRIPPGYRRGFQFWLMDELEKR